MTTARHHPIEFEGGICLGEMEVRTHLYRPIAGIHHADDHDFTASIERDRAVTEDDFARPPAVVHGIGWWTVTSFVPSGKVAST